MYKNYIISILLIISLSVIYLQTNKEPVKVYTDTSKVDSLQSIIDSLETSKELLESKKDSIQVKIIKVEKDYETKYLDIVNQSVDSDIKFFSDYIDKFSKNY